MDARAEILDRLLELQSTVGRELISPGELRRIKEIWADDAWHIAERFVAAHSPSLIAQQA
jgi:hypothetical protein